MKVMLGEDQGDGKLCAFPFQLESGGDMVHVTDLTTQAMRFGLLFAQVLTAGPQQGEAPPPPVVG